MDYLSKDEIHVVSNILDPIQDELDPTVFDNPSSDKPKLKEQHSKWALKAIHQVLKDAGYTNSEDWLSLVLTGSLTTYQYSPESDFDVSLFVDAEVFPEWSRAEMIGVMVNQIDGTKLPGTTHPMQCFVVPPETKKEDLYQPGLRSGYDIDRHEWVVPPERDRVMDVQKELNGYYVYALEAADKMERLLEYEPQKAIQYWHAIHRDRRRDQKQGKGDFALSNLVYKFLANRNLFPAISEVSGEYIASEIAETKESWSLNDLMVERASQELGLRNPIDIHLVEGSHGTYRGRKDDRHQIDIVKWLKPESASTQLKHELVHAMQNERDNDWLQKITALQEKRNQSHDEYRSDPYEVEARAIAEKIPYSLVIARDKKLMKFAYSPSLNLLVFSDMGAKEGEITNHNMLSQNYFSDAKDLVFGVIDDSGTAQTLGRPFLQGFSPDENQYETEYKTQQVVKSAVPGVGFKDIGIPNDLIPEHWKNTPSPQVIFEGAQPSFEVTPEVKEWNFS